MGDYGEILSAVDAVVAHERAVQRADDENAFIQVENQYEATIADLRQQILDLTTVTPVLMGGNFGVDPVETFYPAGIVARLYFQTQTTIRNAAEGRAYAKGTRLFVISTKTVASFNALVKTARPDCKYVWLINHEPEDNIDKTHEFTLADWHARQASCSQVAHDGGHRFATIIMTGTLFGIAGRKASDFLVGPDVADLTGLDYYPKNFLPHTVQEAVDLQLAYAQANGGTPLLIGEYGVPGQTRAADSLLWTQQWKALVDANPYEIVCYWSQGEDVLTQPVADVLYAG